MALAPRIVVCIWFACLIGLNVPRARPQTVEPAATEPTAEHLDQLQKCREGLVDPNARPEDRRRWAELLFSYNTPQAKELVVELLRFAENPDVQRALCGVVAERARESPERLEPGLVEPLIDLLGAADDDLRATSGRALADFPGADVPAKLGALASQADVPLVKRLAAVDALAPNTHRREVVGQLISLLDAGVPEITERVVAALESATAQTFGRDLERWQAWWNWKSQLSDQAWLAEQLQSYRDRLRRVADEFQAYQEQTLREQETLTARIGSFQRELFRALNGDQRDTRLAEWLADPVPVVKLTALGIIKARIADEGKRPEGNVLAALLGLLEQGPPPMRLEVLEIVQNLSDPAVVEAVLAQLEQEKDPQTRHAILKAIGKLDSPEAIPALIQEIARPDSSPQCLREAAIAVGKVAAKSQPTEHMDELAEALTGTYQSVPAGEVATRAALLTAMAGVADAAFAPQFLEALESDETTVLRPAIHGVQAVGDTSKLPRLRTLMAHSDPLVRRAAIEAVGRLGREEADLESLLARLNPAIETNQLAREAAWRGFCEFLSSRPVRERFDSAERLRDMPDLEAKYLDELADSLSTATDSAADLDPVLDRLATVLVVQDRHGEAVEPLRTLYEMRSARSDADAFGCGRRLLDATLRGAADPDVADLIRQLAALGDDGAKAEIVDTVAAYVESDHMTTNTERARKLLNNLRSVPADPLGEAWTQLLERVAAHLEAGDSDAAPDQPPPDK